MALLSSCFFAGETRTYVVGAQGDGLECADRHSAATVFPLGATEQPEGRSCSRMSEQKEKSWLEQVGCNVSAGVSDVAGHPYGQIGVILVCAIWFAAGLATDVLTAVLSILAITLTQMVLNNQAERELDVHRRDVAMHAKLDELIAASRRARNDFVGVEEKDEEEIVQLKEEVKEAIEEEPAAASPEVRETAKRVVEEAAHEVKRTRRKRTSRKSASPAPRKAASR